MPVQSNLSKWKESCAKNVARGKLELAGLRLPPSPGQGLHFELLWYKPSVKIVNC